MFPNTICDYSRTSLLSVVTRTAIIEIRRVEGSQYAHMPYWWAQLGQAPIQAICG